MVHRQHHHFLLNRELDELYVSLAIRSFALGLINIFVPVYLIELGYSLRAVLLFYALAIAVHAVMAIPAGKIAAWKGFKHAIGYSVPLLIAYFGLLYSLPVHGWPLWILAIILGVSAALFWTGFHLDFAHVSDNAHRGRELGVAKIVGSLFQAIGPIVGGLVLAFIGFKVLFVSVSILLVCSVIPLFLSKDAHESYNISLKELFSGEKPGKLLRYAAYGIENPSAVILWPVFIYFGFLKSFATLGSVSSLSLLVSFAVTFMIGKFTDVRRKMVLRLGGIANAVVWAMRLSVRSVSQIFMVDALYGLTKSMVLIPFDALCYDGALKGKAVRAIIVREMTINGAAAIYFLLLALVIDLASSFIAAGGASLLVALF